MSDPIEDFPPSPGAGSSEDTLRRLASIERETGDVLRRLALFEREIRCLEGGLADVSRDFAEEQNVNRHFRSSVNEIIDKSNSLMNEYRFVQRWRGALVLALRSAISSVIEALRTHYETETLAVRPQTALRDTL